MIILFDYVLPKSGIFTYLVFYVHIATFENQKRLRWHFSIQKNFVMSRTMILLFTL